MQGADVEYAADKTTFGTERIQHWFGKEWTGTDA